MGDWESAAKRREAKRNERANLYPMHGSSLRTQQPRPLSQEATKKLRDKGRRVIGK